MTKEKEDAVGMKVVLAVIAGLGCGYLGPLAVKLYWNTFLCAVSPVRPITWPQAVMIGVLVRCLAQQTHRSTKDKPWSEVRNEAWAKLFAWGFTIGLWAVLK